MNRSASYLRWYAWIAPALLVGLMSGCFLRGPGPLVAPSVPMLDAGREAVAQRVALLESDLAARRLSGRRRQDAERELLVLRGRLESGDLRVGDQLVITITGAGEVKTDTATVREGMQVSFASLPDASVAGLLQGEVQPRLQAHTDRFFLNRTVRVNVPTRIAVLGEVVRPGYYAIPSDRPVAELLMLAGGPTPLSALDDITVRRDGRRILSAEAWDRGQRAGLTVGQLGLQSGDELEIARRRRMDWAQFSQLAFVVVGASVALLQLLVIIYREE
jgi:protein involved in polysaccharide export with SLBB domain